MTIQNIDGVELISTSRARVEEVVVPSLVEMVKHDPSEVPAAARDAGASVPQDVYPRDRIIALLLDSAPRMTDDERKRIKRKARRQYDKGRSGPRRQYLWEPDAAFRAARHEELTEAVLERRAANRAADEREAADRPMLADTVLDYRELMDRPPLTPLVAGVLNLDTVALLYAPPATYKTFLALWLAACVALGHTWAGRPVERGPVLYVAAEGVAGIQKRVAALSWHVNASKPIDDLFVYPAPINLTSEADVDELVAFATVRGFRFIVFDTLVKVAGGAEENDNTAMTRVTNAAERVKRATTGSTVLLIHHSGKNGDMRGASALLGNVDTVLKLDGEAGALTLTAVKQKDAEGGEIMRLRKKAVAEHDTLVLEPVAPGDAQPTGVQAARVEESLAHFVRAFSETGATRTQFVDALVEWGVGGRSTVYSYVNELVKNGRLIVAGTASRARLILPRQQSITTFDITDTETKRS